MVERALYYDFIVEISNSHKSMGETFNLRQVPALLWHPPESFFTVWILDTRRVLLY